MAKEEVIMAGVIGFGAGYLLKPGGRPIADLVKAYKAEQISDRDMIIGIYRAIRWTGKTPFLTEAEIEHELMTLNVEAGGDANLWVSRFLNAWAGSAEVAGW